MTENNQETLEYTVSKLHLNKMLDHYRDMLIIKFPNRFITPAFMETLQRELDAYQLIKAKSETNLIWRIPVKVLADARSGNVDVEVKDNVKLTLITP